MDLYSDQPQNLALMGFWSNFFNFISTANWEHVIMMILVIIFLTILVRAINALVEKLSKIYITSRQKHRAPEIADKKLSNIVNLSTDIHQMLRKTLESCNANKISITEFHNGGNNLLGISFFKGSVTYEVTTTGVPQTFSRYQSIPISMFAHWIDDMLNNDGFIEYNVDNIAKTDVSTYEMLKVENTKYIMHQYIRSTNGLPLGFISVSFVNLEPNENINYKELLKSASMMFGMLIDKKIQSSSKDGDYSIKRPPSCNYPKCECSPQTQMSCHYKAFIEENSKKSKLKELIDFFKMK